jgi:hypothetical protein
MGRVDHHRLLVGQEDVVEGVVHVPGVRSRPVRAEQVGPPDRPDKQRTAGQQQERLVRP